MYLKYTKIVRQIPVPRLGTAGHLVDFKIIIIIFFLS